MAEEHANDPDLPAVDVTALTDDELVAYLRRRRV